MGRGCPRRFILLLAGGVRCVWECGAHRDFPNETAVDVEPLATRIDPHHHHRPHLHHRKDG